MTKNDKLERDMERQKFDAWFEAEYKHLESSKYTDAVPHIKYGFWQAWQASRERIEVQSPRFIGSREALNKGFTVDYSNGFGDAMDAYELSLTKAGIKVKS